MTFEKLIFTAYSCKNFYQRARINKFVLGKQGIPINPFMLFDYYLMDSISKEKIRGANNSLVKRCDELWVFGEIADGVEQEISIAEKEKKNIQYFNISHNGIIKKISKYKIKYENKFK